VTRGLPPELQKLLTPKALNSRAGRQKAAVNLLVFIVTGRRCVCAGGCVCGSHMRPLRSGVSVSVSQHNALHSIPFLPRDSNQLTFKFSIMHAVRKCAVQGLFPTTLSNSSFWQLAIAAVVGRYDGSVNKSCRYFVNPASSSSATRAAIRLPDKGRARYFFDSYYLHPDHELDAAYIAHFVGVAEKAR